MQTKVDADADADADADTDGIRTKNNMPPPPHPHQMVGDIKSSSFFFGKYMYINRNFHIVWYRGNAVL